MTPFDFQLPTRILFGPGKIAVLGEVARELAAKKQSQGRVLVVSDPGIVAAGHTEQGIGVLQQAGWTTQLFDAVAENPTTVHVASGLEVARDFQPNLIVGMGGGSSMDCAKGINFLYSCGGQMQDYWGVGKATGPLLPMIAIPTTAGTGSETQSFALISDATSHVKMACGDRRVAFRAAILDPELTLTQPARVTALTGFDAMAHAIETYVTSRRNPISRSFSREAWRHLASHYLPALREPENLEHRASMQWGACLAGLAIENSMLGAAHALANPLTANFGIAHGQAVALMLPAVVRYNGQKIGSQYAQLLAATPQLTGTTIDYKPFSPTGSAPPARVEGPGALVDFLIMARRAAGLAETLECCQVPRNRLPELAAEASQQWTGTFNPVPLSEDEFRQLYEEAYGES